MTAFNTEHLSSQQRDNLLTASGADEACSEEDGGWVGGELELANLINPDGSTLWGERGEGVSKRG